MTERTEDTQAGGNTASRKHVKRAHILVLVLSLTLLSVASAVLLTNAWTRQAVLAEQQVKLVSTSVKGVSGQISQHITDLRRSVRLFAEKEYQQLKHIAKNSHDFNAYDKLVEAVKAEFPNAFAVTLANSKGEPYVDEYNGFISDLCQKDIVSFSQNSSPPGLLIHPNSESYHFDIMVSVDIGLAEKPVFFVSFNSVEVSSILASGELYQYRYYLLKNNSGLVEISSRGSRQSLVEEQYYLSAEEKNRMLYSLPVTHTGWYLVAIPDNGIGEDENSSLWFELMVMLSVLGVVSFLIAGLIKQSGELMTAKEKVDQESKATLALLDHMANTYLKIDKDWKIVNANKQAQIFLRHSLGELVGKSIWDIIPEAASILYKKLNKAKVQKLDVEHEGYYAPLGVWFYLQAFQKDDGLVILIQDITERKLQDAAMRRNEARLRAIFDSTVTAVMTIDKDNLIDSFNKGAEELFGYKPDEIVGQPISVILPDRYKAAHAGYVSNYIRSGIKNFINTTRELEAVRKNGEVFPINVSIGETIIDGQYIFTGVIQDISKRKIAEQEASEALVAKLVAENANKAKSTFLANMSHEIRTPLTAIIGFGETLLQHDLTEAERAESVSTIISSGHHLLDLINDILDISKIEAGKLDVELITVNPCELVNDVVNIVRPQMERKGLGFSVIYHFPLPSVITSDFIRLKQIIINLCSNALKFTSEGHVTIEIRADIDREKIQFDVVDTGIGLNDAEKQRIFTAFTQADSSTTRKFGGTGLGLSLSQQLAVMLGGEIRLSSEPDAGSCFSLSISTGVLDKEGLLYKESDLPEMQTSINLLDFQYLGRQQKLSGHILLAEDNEANQRLLSYMIKKTGATLDLVENGKQAVEAGLANHYDLVFMDMQMPIMGGIDAINMLHKNGFVAPIVALTANALEEDREQCFKSGCVDFVTKPVTRETLYRVMQKYLSDSEDFSMDKKPDIPEPVYSSLLDEEPEYADLLEKFIAELPNQKVLVHQYHGDQDWAALATVIHKLKGSAGSYGYQVLTEMATDIETELLNNNYRSLHFELARFDELLARILSGYAEQISALHADKNTGVQ